MSIEKGLSTDCTPAECYVLGLSRMKPQLHRWARIVEFVYQGAIHKGCPPLNRLLITYLLCKMLILRIHP